MEIKGPILFVFLIGFSVLLNAQTTIDSDAFIRSTIEKLQVVDVYNPNDVRFPWIEELQLRSETRDLDFDSQEYTFRVSPSSPRKLKAQRALLRHYQSPPNTDQSKVYEQTIRTIYADWLSLYFIDKEILVLDTLESIWSDKKKVNDKLLSSYEIDVKEMVGLELQKSNLAQSKFELGMEQKMLQQLHGLEYKNLDHSEMIPLMMVEQKLNEMILLSNSEAMIDDAMAYQYKLDGIQKEIQLEKSEDRQYFDFGQIKYRGPHTDFLEERLSFGIGFKLPRSGNRKLKIAELMMEQQELEAEHLADKEKNNQDVAELVSELKYKLELAKHFSQLISNEKAELDKLAKVLQKKQGYDPLILLDIKESVLSRRVRMLEYEQEIYVDYIKLLGMLGKLAQAPFINYLKA